MFSLYVHSLPQQTKTAFTSLVLFNFIVTATYTCLHRDRKKEHIGNKSRLKGKPL